MKAYALLATILLSGCAQTQLGQSVERYQYADIATTAIGLTQDGITEANPLALYMFPVKIYAGRYIEQLPCQTAQVVARTFNGVTGIVIANNLFVLAGMANPLLWGVIAGSGAWYVSEPLKC